MNARRLELRAAVAKRLVPHFESLGFESTRKKATKARWAELARRGYGYARQRGARVDALAVYWDKYRRPWFYIDFASCEASEIGPDCIPESWRRGILRPARSRFGSSPQWFGKGQRPDIVVDLAIERMAELELYFASGRETAHIHVSEGSGGAMIVRKIPVWERIILPLIGLIMLLALPFQLLWWLLESLPEELRRSRRRPKSSGSARR